MCLRDIRRQNILVLFKEMSSFVFRTPTVNNNLNKVTIRQHRRGVKQKIEGCRWQQIIQEIKYTFFHLKGLLTYCRKRQKKTLPDGTILTCSSILAATNRHGVYCHNPVFFLINELTSIQILTQLQRHCSGQHYNEKGQE